MSLKVTGFSLAQLRIPTGNNKIKLIATIEKARSAIPLKKLLCILGVSSTRFHSWMNKVDCELEGQSTCPKSLPKRLTPDEVREIKAMVTSFESRHVPTGTLSRLAQRLNKVYAFTSTWYRLVKSRG